MSIKSLFAGLVYLLLATQSPYAQSMSGAKEIVDQARTRAKTENKNVFIIFHASWCFWCHKMDTLMNTKEIKPYFDTSYVIVHIDVNENDPAKKKLETPGGNKLFEQYAGTDPSVPFWLILDTSGKVMADSRFRGPQLSPSSAAANIGLPTLPEEIRFFRDVLKRTSSLSEQQVDEIAAVFQRKQGK